MEFHHTTVLLNEMIDSVLTDPHGIYVDCTLGGGGHSFALSQKLADDALLIGIDQDQEAIDAAGERLKDTCLYGIISPTWTASWHPSIWTRWTGSFSTWAFPPTSWTMGNGDFPI